ncbi:hypothetical protein PQO01_00005 [Lentisphaera marina]|uniref:hypothetical protein n=1 Tax=Lentisphaera marina TaxID=1111041 RepID=UPI0023657901|nr:hypothetical protein [Lentisphaera marina]MDD7983334.1 hypothetical protein [Lentisphaera marina]
MQSQQFTKLKRKSSLKTKEVNAESAIDRIICFIPDLATYQQSKWTNSNQKIELIFSF